MRPADLARLAAGTLAACFALLGADQGWPASWLWLLAFAAVGFPLAALLANAPAVVEVARTAPWRGPRATVAGAAAAVVAVALFGWSLVISGTRSPARAPTAPTTTRCYET